MTYALNTDIQARMPMHPWSASSKPSTTDLTNWITLAEGKLTAALKTAQVATPVTDTDGIQLIKSIICDYVEGLARLALSSGVDSSDAQIGEQRRKDFDALVEKVAAGDAGVWAAMLSGGNAPAGACAVRGHVIDNPDGETISGGDFDPDFEKGEAW